MNKALSISPWPSLWVMGPGGGSPSEGYAIEALSAAGFRVTHLVPHLAGLCRCEQIEGIRLVRIPNPFRSLEFLKKTGIGFAYRFLTDSAWALEVSRWLIKSGERFDLVVGHGLEAAFALPRARKMLGIPGIARVYGTSVPIQHLRKGIRREGYFDLLYILRHPPEHIIMTDDGTCGGQALEMFGVPPDRCHFLMNGYDPGLLSYDTTEKSPPYVITASRFTHGKRLDRVARIAQMCRDEAPELRFLILGDGPLRGSVQRLIRKLGVESTVHLPGMVSRSTVHLMLARSSVVLSPHDTTNLVNTTLEALVLGKPVVTFDVGCTSKLIHHESTGLLYQYDDLEGAARGIIRLVKDRNFRKNLGRRARGFALGKLMTWPERFKKEVEIYKSFLG